MGEARPAWGSRVWPLEAPGNRRPREMTVAPSASSGDRTRLTGLLWRFSLNDEGLADAAAANPFRLPGLHPGNGSLGWVRLEWLEPTLRTHAAATASRACGAPTARSSDSSPSSLSRTVAPRIAGRELETGTTWGDLRSLDKGGPVAIFNP